MGQGLKQKEVVTYPGQLKPWNGGSLGPAADGDQQPIRLQGAGRLPTGIDNHTVGTAQAGPTFHKADTGLDQALPVDSFETGDFVPHPLKQHPALGYWCGELPAVGPGILGQVPEGGAVNQQLFGNTPPDHTGAADPISLDDGHPGAVAGSPFGGGQTAGTSTNDE